MKIYFPLNLKVSLFLNEKSVKIYGWIDDSTNNIFICSFIEPNWFSEFSEIGIEKITELGYISDSPKSPKSIRLSNISKFLNISDMHLEEPMPIVIIYYKIYKELSRSADFSHSFANFPFKQIKWASILNCNKNGQFLKLTNFQKSLTSAVRFLLSLETISSLNSLAQSNSLRNFQIYSHTSQQFFMKKDHFSEMYKYLLLNESVLSDSGRNHYRNSLILTVSDLVFGTFFVSHLISIALPWIQSSFFKFFTIEFFEIYLDWFMGWPAGFKFNANLTKFFGKFFLSLLALWKVLFFPWLELNNANIYFIGNFKIFGLSFLIAIITDFWSLSTLHIKLFYRLTMKIYWIYCVLMLSLFRLFRGKKWNVLRKRVDQTEYSMDQLLVGMLLFSMLFCTFPTVTAYYLLFTISHLFVLSLKCLLESFTLILNFFPIYFLILKSLNNPILTERIRLVPYELETKNPSFILNLETWNYLDIFADLIDQLTRCWVNIFNFTNVYNIIVGRAIKE